MNILFLSFYFEPDLCAGSFRNTPLFRELLNNLEINDYIHVITTEPNRYSTFEASGLAEEVGEQYKINRIVVPKHASGMMDQAKSFSVFYKNAIKLIKGEHFDIVYASSSRLFTAFLGRRCASKNKCPLFLDIRDIFVDTMKSIFASKKYIQIPAVFILRQIEKYTFRNATHINLVSEGFREYFSKYKNPKFSFFTNAIDEVFMNAGIPTKQPVTKPYIITYAGNIGSGQGLEKIIPEAARKLGEDYEFHIIGDGGTRPKLEAKLNGLSLTNVKLLKPVARKELIEHYNASTFLFFHLNDLDAFKKVLPSKMFEYGAFDKPIIAGVSGYAYEFVEKYIPNHILFNPTDVDDFVKQIMSYELRFEERTDFKKQFSRTSINRELAKCILATARK